jgi:hypothetical protein
MDLRSFSEVSGLMTKAALSRREMPFTRPGLFLPQPPVFFFQLRNAILRPVELVAETLQLYPLRRGQGSLLWIEYKHPKHDADCDGNAEEE